MYGTWTQIDIAGKPADVYEPPDGRARFGVLFLHAYDGRSLRDQSAFTGLFDAFGMVCVCPFAPHSWWADRACPVFDLHLTAEQHLLRNVVPEFKERWRLEPRALALLGVSMGGQGALRLAFKDPTTFAVAAGVASAIEYHELYGQGLPLDEMYDSKEQCRQDTAPMLIHPSRFPPHLLFCCDPDDAHWYRGNDRLHEKLNALGVEHEVDLTTRAGGHTWAYFNHMADRVVRFLHAGLEQQSRRLL
jgi:pimeloyl-ACP methyl ester carboxylesterase